MLKWKAKLSPNIVNEDLDAALKGVRSLSDHWNPRLFETKYVDGGYVVTRMTRAASIIHGGILLFSVMFMLQLVAVDYFQQGKIEPTIIRFIGEMVMVLVLLVFVIAYLGYSRHQKVLRIIGQYLE